MRIPSASLVAAAGVMVAATLASPAEAQGRHDRYAPQGQYVVAESWYGKGTATGPVRPGRVGWQVRLPGGTWIDCVRSCSDTLRRNTVDFWESGTSHGRGDDSPGYFRFQFGPRRY